MAAYLQASDMSLCCTDPNDSHSALPVENGGEEDIMVPGAERYKRGTSTYVFIPDEEIPTHILNQTDLTKMDYFLPG